MILQRQVEKDSKLTEGGDGLLLFAQFPPASLIICPFSLYHLACMNKHSVWEPDKISTSFMKRCTGIAKPFKKNNKKKNFFFSFYVFFFSNASLLLFFMPFHTMHPPKMLHWFPSRYKCVTFGVPHNVNIHAHTHTHRNALAGSHYLGTHTNDGTQGSEWRGNKCSRHSLNRTPSQSVSVWKGGDFLAVAVSLFAAPSLRHSHAHKQICHSNLTIEFLWQANSIMRSNSLGTFFFWGGDHSTGLQTSIMLIKKSLS